MMMMVVVVMMTATVFSVTATTIKTINFTMAINSCMCLHKKIKRALSSAGKENHVTIGRPLA